ncbi:hypothetical protein KRIGEM_00415 [Komagataeibacter rhaeticus]|nr:hypothetical protein KRIGEM_00415 [Komagataeibacter rhaeticus]
MVIDRVQLLLLSQLVLKLESYLGLLVHSIQTAPIYVPKFSSSVINGMILSSMLAAEILQRFVQHSFSLIRFWFRLRRVPMTYGH